MSKKTNEVAVVEPTTSELVNFDPSDCGISGLDQSDFIIPRLSITQPTTPEIEAEDIGKFRINVTGDFLENMRVGILKIDKTRILFPDKYKRDNDPLCRSHDFKVPADDIDGATPMCNSCGMKKPTEPGERSKHLCEYANWTTGNTPPKCQEVWNFLIFDLDLYMPMWFSVKSTGLKSAKLISSAINMLSKAKSIPTCGIEIELKLSKVTNDSGTFYIPVFKRGPFLEMSEINTIHGIQKELGSADVNNTEADTPDAPPAAEKTDEEF